MNELVVSKTETGLRIALLEDRRIVELHNEKADRLFSVGDIFLARVRKLVPGLNAAFVDIGHERDAFLHYTDLGPQVNSLQKYTRINFSDGKNVLKMKDFKPLPDIRKDGKISQVLKNNQKIMVQVVKEAISTKGARLSSEISIPGQFMILVPFSRDISISRKIRSEKEKKRLKVLTESIKPDNFGLIVRTAAEGKSIAALEADLKDLTDKWMKMVTELKKIKGVDKILSEEQRTTSILRDMLGETFDRIYVDDQVIHDQLLEYLEKKLPDMVKNLKLYKGKSQLFEYLGLEKQIKASFGKTVTMRKGSYLVIEHTEALHVVDVNSGSKNLKGDTLEDNALTTNMEAVREIARQLRLRDMGGIIVIDFIDVRNIQNKKALFAAMKEAMSKDRAKHSILPLSRFGLMQITRQRVRPEINITTVEQCPSCQGSGKIQPSILIIDQIESNVEFLLKQNSEKGITLLVNPYVGSFLKKGFWNFPIRWFWQYKKRVRVVVDNSLAFTEIRYYNAGGEEIQLLS